MRLQRYLAIAIAGFALVVAPVAATSAAADEPAAQLSIAIDNDRESVEAGDELTYTLTVQNLGANPVTDLTVTQSMPAGLEFGAADTGGTSAAGEVTWLLSIEADSEVTVQTTMTVAETPATMLRLASIACAGAAVDAPPVVCATDSDQLPAGAAMQAQQAESQDAGPPVLLWGAVAVGGFLVLASFLTFALLRRRRRAAEIRQ